MLLKFFNRGTGKGKAPVEYLLKEKDANGVQREPLPEVVKGSPEQTIRLIDSLDFKHKYRSGVISFAASDAPTLEQQQAVIDSFEQTAFAGLDRDRYNNLWVRHTHTGEGRVELHFITPRVELTTGKSLNIAPPGWGNYFRPWRDYWNESQRWASPDDPQRARTYHPGYDALVNAQNHRLELAGKSIQTREDTRKVITNYLVENIRMGLIKDRQDTISILERSELKVTRAGENYLTVYSEKTGTRLRLKGGIYCASWRLGERPTAEARRGQETDRSAALTRAREAETELRARVLERTEYHQSRYGALEANHQPTMEMVFTPARGDDYQPLARFLNRQLGDDALLSQPVQRDSNPEADLRNPQEPDLGSGTVSDRQRQISDSATRHRIPDQLEVQRQALLEAVNSEDERTRTTVTTDLQELCRSIRAGQEAARRTNRQLSAAGLRLVGQRDQVERTSRAVSASLSGHHERLGRIEMKRSEELDRFKLEINLVEYAQSVGYEIDRLKSSQNCIVLKDSAGDKILVGVDLTDHHYFYYSVRDERDSGSVIDFIQNRKRLNLGEVRLELRPWLSGSHSPTHSQREPAPLPIPTSKDSHKILAQFESFQASANHPYLNERGITSQTISARRFEGTIYTDHRGNAVFPHRDRVGVCGYEIRNHQFKGFSNGGTKGLWVSRSSPDDQQLVICESPIDCLSYHQLFPNAQTRYFATGGTLSEKQKDLLRTAMERLHSQGGEIVIAVDRDDAGQKITQELKQIAPQTAQIYRHVPNHQKDWNEALQAQIAWERQQHNQRSRGRGFSL